MLNKRLIALLMILCLSLGFAGCGKEDEKVTNDTSSEEETHTHKGDLVELNLWYTDANMTDYFTFVIEKFQQENEGVTVNLNLVAANDYLDNINTQSIKQVNAVDVYMLHNENIEQAYLAGLAESYDPTDTVYNADNYGKSAIRAVTYNGKQVAYPLYFDSAFLVYNKAYVQEAPTTFDGIKEFSNNLEYEDENSVLNNIEKTFVWPVSDYKFNYQFLSDSFNVGGVNGDDRTSLNVNNDTVASSLEYFQSLYSYFAINRNEVTYEKCLQDFIDGKYAFTLCKIGAIDTLQKAKASGDGFDYGTACMPDISDMITASSLSYTQTLVINPYSLNKECAKNLVKALSYDYAGYFYGKTGYFPSCKDWKSETDIAQGIYDNYDDSTPMPKMLTLGDYYIEIEILLHKVWDQDGEIVDLLNEFQDYITVQVN